MSVLEHIPESHRHLLEDATKAFAFVAAAAPSGPQLTMVWFNTDGQHILFGTTDKAAKFRFFSKDPRIAVAIPDPQNPYQYLQLRGKVRLTEEGAVEHTHELSRKYTGEDFKIPEGVKRVKYIVTPGSITAWPPAR
ncbi:MAG: pyridoxamine 5'-phosphate oxidase family protein [Anaerolineales bacterium]|nr:pyridoxamine 5'-phosphate oxidase family protein [Anaerolineales bacterium]